MSIVEYKDNDSKIEEEVTKFYAILLCCSDYPCSIEKYADIDNITDYETINEYYPIAKDKIYFDKIIPSEIDYRDIEIVDLESANKIIDLQMEQIKMLRKENRDLKLDYCKCRDCIHADLYIPGYTYPYADPKCELRVKTIHSDSNACEDFKRIGRNSR